MIRKVCLQITKCSFWSPRKMMLPKWSKMSKKIYDQCERKQIRRGSQLLLFEQATKLSFNQWFDTVLLPQQLLYDCELLLFYKQASCKICVLISMYWHDLLKNECSYSPTFRKQLQRPRSNLLILYRRLQQCFSLVLHKNLSWKTWWCLAIYLDEMQTSWKACDLCSVKYLQRENWQGAICFSW